MVVTPSLEITTVGMVVPGRFVWAQLSGGYTNMSALSPGTVYLTTVFKAV